MERSTSTSSTTNQQRRFFRKQIVLPAEHGSWSWLLVPYFVGLLVAGQWNLDAFLVLIGGLAAFLVRQPASVYMRVRAGKGRKSDRPIAAAWSLVFGLLALFCLFGLLVLGRIELLWLLIPMIPVFVLYMAAARQRRASVRTLWMELAGAVGLASMAPAAYIAASGQLNLTAWMLWGLMAGQNGLGVMYVRLRIADTHKWVVNRLTILWAHGLVLGITMLGAFIDLVPWLAILPFVGYLARAVWVARRERPISHIKRFGFTEIGVEILGGFFIALGWMI